MDHQLKYGLGLLGAGAIVVLAMVGLASPDGAMVGVFVMSAGAILLYLNRRNWYCQACGRSLGRGDQPTGTCNRCGSDRIGVHDPGAGDTARIHSD